MTELDAILSSLVDQVDGALVVAVGGMDGLLVEQYPGEGHDLAATAAELADVLASSRAVMAGAGDGGSLRELVVGGEHRVAYARLLNDDLYCLILLDDGGSLGKARLYSQHAAARLLQVLA